MNKMKYTLSYNNPSNHYLHIEAEISTQGKAEIELQFPAWRPGRYELGNFAKNIKNFVIYDNDGKKLSFQKTTKDKWVVQTNGQESIKVDYYYYAFELNAGSTFLDEKQLYVNPVNCFIYNPDLQEEACTTQLVIPEDYRIACSMKHVENCLEAESYHELVDSPFIASPTLQHFQFKHKETNYHLWFQGECKIDWKRVKKDFLGYTKNQVKMMGEFPVSEYHYIYQITPYRTYHGVEHSKSTVCALGPTYDLMGSLYEDFMGVSSHELYHTWNIKAIRPSEMFPYNYSKENHSKMGYVAEGVTTYLGDLFLLRGKVFDLKWYLKELTSQIQRHIDNDGRLNMSVADSSYDTWLDGYVAGVPGRKVSIYTEGCLLAFVLDVYIQKHTENKKSIHDVMHVMYHDYAKQGKPYTEEIYKSIAEEISGQNLDWLFNDYVNDARSYEGLIMEALETLGYELKKKDNPKISEREHGVVVINNEIKRIATGSPADMVQLSLNDKIEAINGFKVNNDIDKWFEYFKGSDMTLTINRAGEFIQKKMPQVNLNFWNKYEIVPVETTYHTQREAFNKWSNRYGKSK